MKLSEYLEKNPQISVADIGRLVGRDPSTVHRWRRGETMPEVDALKKIFDLTEGQVSANDFIDGMASAG